MQQATVAPADRGARAGTARPGYGATVRSEWTKFSSVRSNWVSLAVALVLSAGLTALLAWAIGFTWDDWSAADRAEFDPITFSMTGLLISGIILVVLGVNLAASEYSSGMIRQTFSATPRRGRVLLAKCLVIALVTILASLVMSVAVMVAGNLVFGLHDMPTMSLTDRDMMRAIAGLTLVGFVFPVIGVAVAFILRSAAAAITAVLALLFLPSMFGPLLPSRWQEDVLAWLPGPLTDSASIGFIDPDAAMTKDVWMAIAGMLVWLVIFVGGAWVLINRRDA